MVQCTQAQYFVREAISFGKALEPSCPPHHSSFPPPPGALSSPAPALICSLVLAYGAHIHIHNSSLLEIFTFLVPGIHGNKDQIIQAAQMGLMCGSLIQPSLALPPHPCLGVFLAMY